MTIGVNKMTIGGYTYSTDTAQKLCSIEGSSLYRTETGLFFLCEAGQIMPLPYAEAKAWAEEFAPDVYQQIFAKEE